MLRYRVTIGILCALLLSGAILGTTPSCGRKIGAARPACCRNEATCPMHQKDASGFNACHDGEETIALVTPHSAVLAMNVFVDDIPPREHRFASRTMSVLPSPTAAPWTPPPRFA